MHIQRGLNYCKGKLRLKIIKLRSLHQTSTVSYNYISAALTAGFRQENWNKLSARDVRISVHRMKASLVISPVGAFSELLFFIIIYRVLL
jgi:hypothetical protein